MRRSLLRTLVYSLKTSLLNIVKRPFKSGGKFYPAGTIIESPAGIHLYKTKVKDGIIVKVDEHNLEYMSTYLKHRRGVEDAQEVLTKALKERKAYIAKVKKAAEQYDIVVDGRIIEDVVAEIKLKAEEAKSKQPKK